MTVEDEWRFGVERKSWGAEGVSDGFEEAAGKIMFYERMWLVWYL